MVNAAISSCSFLIDDGIVNLSTANHTGCFYCKRRFLEPVVINEEHLKRSDGSSGDDGERMGVILITE